MTLSNELSDDELKIYRYWWDLPAIKGLDQKSTEISEQEIRGIIVNKMRTGIDDAITKKYDLPRRHAFSAQELLEIVNTGRDDPVKISNIYFHLDKLIEIDLVQEVVSIKRGRHKIRYFGRTAKLFLKDFKVEDKVDHREMETIINTILALNEDLAEDDAEELIQQYLRKKVDLQNKALKWLEVKHETFKSRDIDFAQLMKIIVSEFTYLDPELFDISKKFAELIGFDPTAIDLDDE